MSSIELPVSRTVGAEAEERGPRRVELLNSVVLRIDNVDVFIGVEHEAGGAIQLPVKPPIRFED